MNCKAPETHLDDVVATLANRRRRYALYHLREEEILDIDALARQVVAWEADRPAAAVSEDDVEKVLLEFQHSHLAMLRDAGCIEYDERTEVVRYREPPATLVELLDVLEDAERPTET